MTLNVVVGACIRVPFMLQSIYAPPLLYEMTTIGPKYLGCIFQLRAFSITVFCTSTRSPVLKSKSCIVWLCSHLNWIAALFRAWCTLPLRFLRSACRFCRAMACRTMRLPIERRESGGGSR